MNIKVICPVCDADILLNDDTKVSEVVKCTECGTQLVVDKIDGIDTELSVAPEVEEDWGE